MSIRPPPLESQSLTQRVRLLLRGDHRTLPALSDREAIAALRPFGQGVQAVSAKCPLTNNVPELATADGTLGEREFGVVSDSTG